MATLSGLIINGKRVSKLTINGKIISLIDQNTSQNTSILYEGDPIPSDYSWSGDEGINITNVNCSSDGFIIYYCDSVGSNIAKIDFGTLEHTEYTTSDFYEKEKDDYYIGFRVVWINSTIGDVIEYITFTPSDYYINKIETYKIS